LNINESASRHVQNGHAKDGASANGRADGGVQTNGYAAVNGRLDGDVRTAAAADGAHRREEGLSDEAAEALRQFLEMPTAEAPREEERGEVYHAPRGLADVLRRYVEAVAADLGVDAGQAARFVLSLPAGRALHDMARRLGVEMQVDPLLAPAYGETLARWLARTAPEVLWRVAPGYYLQRLLKMRRTGVPLEGERFVLL